MDSLFVPKSFRALEQKYTKKKNMSRGFIFMKYVASGQN